MIAEPEDCHACYRLIRLGETHYLTIDNAMLCQRRVWDMEAIRVADEVIMVVEDGKLLVRRGSAPGEVLPSDVRHLVDALVVGGVRVVLSQDKGAE